jgi:hypothetical protein
MRLQKEVTKPIQLMALEAAIQDRVKCDKQSKEEDRMEGWKQDWIHG